jgi:hypothetical protein
MVMIYRAKSGGAAAGTQFPHIWVKDQTGCTSIISDTGGGYVDNADNKAGQFLQAKMDDTNIYIDKWLDPASQPSSFVGTTSTKGRHHDSVIFTVGAVTYMLVCEWEQADNANAAVTTLFQIATDGTVTSLESKSHPRITAMEYFTLGGEHYVLLNQRATAPATNSVAGRLIIYQINTATKKFGTSWTSPADKDFLKADLFIDGSKAVLTLGTDNKSATAAHKDAVCYDFDEASGFHNARNVAILNQNPYINSGVNQNFIGQNPNNQIQNQSSSFLNGDFIKGALIGAVATYILTNKNAQESIFETINKVKNLATAGFEELKERIEDAKAASKVNEQEF